jgi:hypothetical protein
MIRPKNPRDVAESIALTRIASLAAQILITLRTPGRSGGYDSERILRGWLAEDGYQFSSNDLAPALALLEAAGYLEHPPFEAMCPVRAG